MSDRVTPDRKKSKEKFMRARRTKAKPVDSPTAPFHRKSRGRKLLEWWVDGELEFYVQGFISDSDYVQLRKNLCDIAEAYAANQKAKA